MYVKGVLENEFTSDGVDYIELIPSHSLSSNSEGFSVAVHAKNSKAAVTQTVDKELSSQFIL